MDQNRLDGLTRSFATLPSRRHVLRGLVGIGFGLGARRPAVAAANQKRKKNGARPNTYGCLDVGQPCTGKDTRCCSGVCQGKWPRKGKPDRSRCVAHDASTCQAGQRDQDVCGGATNVDCTTSAGEPGGCNTTTGNAPYCMKVAECHACQKDADCRPYCGEAAACIQCTGCITTGGTACAGTAEGLCGFPEQEALPATPRSAAVSDTHTERRNES